MTTWPTFRNKARHGRNFSLPDLSSWNEKTVSECHQILTDFESAYGVELAAFRIADDEIQPKLVGASRIGFSGTRRPPFTTGLQLLHATGVTLTRHGCPCSTHGRSKGSRNAGREAQTQPKGRQPTKTDVCSGDHGRLSQNQRAARLKTAETNVARFQKG